MSAFLLYFLNYFFKDKKHIQCTNKRSVALRIEFEAKKNIMIHDILKGVKNL